jgi:hypothetical protein
MGKCATVDAHPARMLKSLALIALISFGTCFGKIYENVADLPRLEYDFVIVGIEIFLFKRFTTNLSFVRKVVEQRV